MVAASPVPRGATSNMRPRILHSFVADPSTGSKGRRASSVTDPAKVERLAGRFSERNGRTL